MFRNIWQTYLKPNSLPSCDSWVINYFICNVPPKGKKFFVLNFNQAVQQKKKKNRIFETLQKDLTSIYGLVCCLPQMLSQYLSVNRRFQDATSENTSTVTWACWGQLLRKGEIQNV